MTSDVVARAVRPAPRGRHGPADDPVGHAGDAPPAGRVTSYDDELRSLVADMVATMYAADGVGLAACQIGVDLAVFVFDCPDASGERTVGVVCNPVLDAARGQGPQARRGRGGLPVVPGRLRRLRATRLRARVTGTGLDGAPVTFEGDGLLARCLQHETDHTLGTVFGDRLLDQGAQEAPEGAGQGRPTTSRRTGRREYPDEPGIRRMSASVCNA